MILVSVSILDKLWGMVSGLVPFLLVLIIIVFVHEMGHFLIARYNGVHVTAFSIGYGPELFGWTDKKGTRWRFSALPLGGYVMMLGDSDASSVKTDLSKVNKQDVKKTLSSKTPLQKIAVAFGGPFANILFSLVIFVFIGTFKGIPDMEPQIREVAENSIAQSIGLKEGDVIKSINGVDIKGASELNKLLKKYKGRDIDLCYKRGNEEHCIKASLYSLGSEGNKINKSMLGVTLSGDIFYIKTAFFETIWYGIKYYTFSAIMMFKGIAGAFGGNSDGAKIGGILSIGEIASKSLQNGIIVFFNFLASLSFSLAIINLLPIPVLDGGSIAINALEFIRGRPLSNGTINFVYGIGLVIVGFLLIWSIWNDLVRYKIVDNTINFLKKLVK